MIVGRGPDSKPRGEGTKQVQVEGDRMGMDDAFDVEVAAGVHAPEGALNELRDLHLGGQGHLDGEDPAALGHAEKTGEELGVVRDPMDHRVREDDVEPLRCAVRRSVGEAPVDVRILRPGLLDHCLGAVDPDDPGLWPACCQDFRAGARTGADVDDACGTFDVDPVHQVEDRLHTLVPEFEVKIRIPVGGGVGHVVPVRENERVRGASISDPLDASVRIISYFNDLR